MKKLVRRILASTTAAATLMGASVLVGPAADASTNNAVLLGDSYFANTTLGQIVDARLTGKNCVHGSYRVATVLQQQHNIPVDDWSCNGATIDGNSNSLITQAEGAARAGDLNASTRVVTLLAGMNDVRLSRRLPNGPALSSAYDRTIATIRRAAPNARIVIMNYPHIAAPTGVVCPVRLWGFAPLPLNLPIVPDTERILTDIARDSAARNGVEFLNMQSSTAGHDMCRIDQGAWVAGVLDNQSAPYNLTLHLTAPGTQNMSNQIARYL